jgi:hypothetical protein
MSLVRDQRGAMAVTIAIAIAIAHLVGVQAGINRHYRPLLYTGHVLGYFSYKATPSTPATAVSQT